MLKNFLFVRELSSISPAKGGGDFSPSKAGNPVDNSRTNLNFSITYVKLSKFW